MPIDRDLDRSVDFKQYQFEYASQNSQKESTNITGGLAVVGHKPARSLVLIEGILRQQQIEMIESKFWTDVEAAITGDAERS